MKRFVMLFVLLVFVTSFAYAAGNVPTEINYQGYVTSGGTGLTGTGYFKFALVTSGGEYYWSNDDNIPPIVAPSAYVSTTVSSGVFNIILGNTSESGTMVALNKYIFSDPAAGQLYLRVWFCTTFDGTYEQMTTDKKITASGYAINCDAFDNTIAPSLTLDSDSTGASTQDITVVAKQGTDTNYGILKYDGTNNKWRYSNNGGTSYANFASGTGDVTGPGSSTDNDIARFDSTTGKIIQDSGVTVSDTNVIATASGDITIQSSAASSDINLTAGSGGDVNVPQNVGLSLSTDDAEKIESDGTDLTISSGGDLLLAATGADISSNAPITFSFGVAMTAASYQIGRNADATNLMAFNVPTGASWEWTVNDSTIAALSTTGSFASSNIILGDDRYLMFGNDATTPDTAIFWNTAQTVDALFLGLSAAQNVFTIAEYADRGYDFAHAAQTNPTVFIQSANQSATEWGSLAHNQTDFIITTGTGDLLLSVAGDNIAPSSDNDCALGTSNLKFSDLFLANGGVINWNASNVTLTHSSNLLTLAGGGFKSTLGATDKVYIDGSTTRTGTTEALDIDATIDTTVAADGVSSATVTAIRAATDTGGTYGIKSSVTTGNMASAEWSFNYGGSYVTSYCSSDPPSNAAVFYAGAGTSDLDCNDYGIYVATGYDYAGYFNGTVSVTTSLGVAGGKFNVDSSGNVTKINNITYSWPSVAPTLNQVLKCTNATGGVLEWAAKSFIINHPLDKDKILVHACLEGPENGVYYRGIAEIKESNTIAEVELPKYFEKLVRKDGRTVLATVMEDYNNFNSTDIPNVKVSSIYNGCFKITADNACMVSWEVKGVRRDLGNLPVEIDKTDYVEGKYRELEKRDINKFKDVSLWYKD